MRLLEQKAFSKRFLFVLAEARDAVLLKTCLYAFRDEWQNAKDERQARQTQAWSAQLKRQRDVLNATAQERLALCLVGLRPRVVVHAWKP